MMIRSVKLSQGVYRIIIGEHHYQLELSHDEVCNVIRWLMIQPGTGIRRVRNLELLMERFIDYEYKMLPKAPKKKREC